MNYDQGSKIYGHTSALMDWAPVLGLSRGAMYAAVKRGDIPVVRIGNSLRVLCRPMREKLGIGEFASTTKNAA